MPIVRCTSPDPAPRMLAAAAALLAALCGSPSAAAGSGSPPPVTFLAAEPTADGALDPGLERLPVRELAGQDAATGREVAEPVRYRLAYGARFLYLFVDAPGESIAARDRAYQNGDGVLLVLAAPHADGSPSDEFLVLGFSPPGTGGRKEKFVWYRNRDLAFTPLEATVATRAAGGRIAWELVVPWRSVAPFHPWLSPALGFNMCVVRAVGAREKVYYLAAPDPKLQSEQSDRRYLPLGFEPPGRVAAVQAFAQLASGHVREGDPLRFRAAAVGPEGGAVDWSIVVRGGEGDVAARIAHAAAARPRPTVDEVVAATPDLPAGGYQVAIRAGAEDGGVAYPLSVLPRVDLDRLARSLDAAPVAVPPGTRATLAFGIAQARAESGRLRAYDSAAELRALLQRLAAEVDAAARGVDPLAGRAGLLRRAYRSALDGTLQPHSIRVPEPLDAAAKHPLVVFLHGSGEDDRGMLDGPLGAVPPGFFALAPNGRGTSNLYHEDHAQDDVREAVDDALRNYPIDPRRIVLAGFSMGGYGVYRTQLETPGRFLALAVFSGQPDMARAWGVSGAPDFLDPANLAPFKGVRIFVFHGGLDRNCPTEKTLALVERLRAAGAAVEFHLDPAKGHETPALDVLEAYRAWLLRVAGAAGN